MRRPETKTKPNIVAAEELAHCAETKGLWKEHILPTPIPGRP